MRDIGREDAEVIGLLVRHATSATGTVLTEAAYDRPPRVGEFIRVSRVHATAKPGSIRIYLDSLDAVRRVRDAFEGQWVEVGTDVVGFRVRNDQLEASTPPGRGGGGP